MKTGIVTKKVRIGGMTCVSCQNKIEKKLRSTAGVESVKVSYSAGTADLIYDTKVISFKDICSIVEKLDYQILAEHARPQPNTVRVIGILMIIVALYMLLERFGVLNLLVPSQLADTKMGYGMLFVIGLITSIHCVAMCGGINLSQCIPHAHGKGMNALAAKRGRKSRYVRDTQVAARAKESRFATFAPAFLYNLGRVISYTVIGFILGLVGLLFGGGGANAGLPVFAQGILKLIAGIFMVIMGINMLGIFPWFRKLQPRMPKFFARKVNTEKAKSKSPLIVGLLNGLMPCGPLQSMQIVALASGNPLAGALSMLLFSLGTVPLMLGLGSIVSALGKKFTQKVMSIGAVLVVVLGIAMLSQGGSLSGFMQPDLLLSIVIGMSAVGIVTSIPFRKPSYKMVTTVAASFVAILSITLWSVGAASASGGVGAENGANNQVVGGKQLITSTLSSGRYPNITVQVGTPVKWVISAPKGSINGCNNRINIQKYGIENYSFKPGENVIEFTPTETGRFQYSCWMGMIRGSITVTEAGVEAAANNDGPASGGSTGSGDALSASPAATPVPAGYKIPTEKVAVAEETTDSNGSPFQKVSIELTDNGFIPAVVVVKAGQEVLWIITNSASGAESGTQLLVPTYAAQLTLDKGENPLAFSPEGSFDFYTGDSAFYGFVKVVDDLRKVDIAAIKKEVSEFKTLKWPPETFQDAQSGGSGGSGQAAEATIKDGVQYVTSTVRGRGYEPIKVQQGIPVKWTLNVPSGALNGCNNAIAIPEYNLAMSLKTGDNLIEFTPDRSGTFVFSCWMGMVRSSITVSNTDGTVDQTQDDGSDALPSCH